MSDWTAASKEYDRLFDLLSADVATAYVAARVAGDQYSRRQYVRAVFTMQEALTYSLKQMALASDNEEHVLSPGERMLLAEQTYDLDHTGTVKTKPARLPRLNNLRFAFATHAKVVRCDFILPVAEEGWEKLRKAVHIRNRLTHPKRAADIEVSAGDIEDVVQGHDWFVRSMQSLMQASADAYAARLREREASLATSPEGAALLRRVREIQGNESSAGSAEVEPASTS